MLASEAQELSFNELVKVISEGRCILFLGAGIHVGPPKKSTFKYPPEHRPLSGRELAKELDKLCGYTKKFAGESKYDLQRISLCFENTPGLGRQALINHLDKFLREGKKPSPILKMLAELPFRIFITTNYDPLLETALRTVGKEPEIFVYDPQPCGKQTKDAVSDPTEQRPMVFKMHGDLSQANRESIVITDEDYINFVQRMADKEEMHPVPQTIRFFMKKWTTLFVGYSLRDYNLRLLFSTLRWKIDKANIPNAFSLDPRPDPLILHVWEKEKHYISFIQEDLWTFVPDLYTNITKCGIVQ